MADDPANVLPSEASLPLPALDNTLGALLIGAFMASILAGVSAHQTYRYFRHYQNDNLWTKGTVATLSILDLLHEVLVIHVCYYYLITNYFNPVSLLSGVWSLRLIIPTTGAMSVVSHIFFARRIVILSGNKRIAIPVAIAATLLVMSEIAFCAATEAYLWIDETFARFIDHSSWLVSTALGMRVLIDIFIAGAMTYLLQTSRTGFRKTDSILDKLIRFSLSTGLLTTIANLASVITAIVLPDALIYCAIYIFSSKLYSNSVISVLDSRQSHGKDITEITSNSTTWLEMSDRVSAACRNVTSNVEFAHHKDSAEKIPSGSHYNSQGQVANGAVYHIGACN